MVPFEDHTPVFRQLDDPYIMRFHVKPLVILNDAPCIPITADVVWNSLSFTRDLAKNSPGWPYKAQPVAPRV